MTLRLGLLSTADINSKLLGGARVAEGVEVVAVASRTRERAEAFAAVRAPAMTFSAMRAVERMPHRTGGMSPRDIPPRGSPSGRFPVMLVQTGPGPSGRPSPP